MAALDTVRNSGAALVEFPVFNVETSCDGRTWDCTRPVYCSALTARKAAAELRGTGYPYVRVRPLIAKLGHGLTP